MRIVVIGAGAVGSTYGALLARGGAEVTLVDVDLAVVAAIARDGVVLEGPGGDVERVPVAIAADASAAAAADAVLVLAKATATAAVARSLAPVLREDAVAVTLQNGLGNDVVLAAALGARRVVAGSTTAGAVLRAPGVVRVAPGTLTGASLTSLQAPAGEAAADRVRALASALDAAGLPTEVLPDVGQVIWRKLALAAAIGPLCAVLRCTVADVLARPAAMRVLATQFGEIVAVAAAEGVVLDREALWRHALSTFATIGPHRPSIAVDVAAGRPTEIDAQAGEVQRRGERAGVPTPATDLVAGLVRAIGAAA